MRLLAKRLLLFAIAVTPLLPSVSLRAVTIAEHIEGTLFLGNTDFVGQSFTTTPGGAFNNIAFKFFSQSMTSFTCGNPDQMGAGFS